VFYVERQVKPQREAHRPDLSRGSGAGLARARITSISVRKRRSDADAESQSESGVATDSESNSMSMMSLGYKRRQSVLRDPVSLRPGRGDLLRFDRGAAAWIWDLDRIRGKGYSDSVVDHMLGKLRQLPHHTQTALQQLVSLGNVAEVATLSVVFGQSEEEIHTALLEARRTGVILRLERSYAFPHDRIQEAAYALFPESERAGAPSDWPRPVG
jgi:hypothetical protein